MQGLVDRMLLTAVRETQAGKHTCQVAHAEVRSHWSLNWCGLARLQ